LVLQLYVRDEEFEFTSFWFSLFKTSSSLDWLIRSSKSDRADQSAMGLKITAAAVHAAPVFMDKRATLEKVAGFIAEAEGSVDLLVFPETFVPGYPVSIVTRFPNDQF
jgi:hypothetical protein